MKQLILCTILMLGMNMSFGQPMGQGTIIDNGVIVAIDEIEKWISENINAGLSYSVLDIEENWYNENKNNIPQKVYDIIEYSKSRSLENGMHFELYERVKKLFY